MSPAPAVVEVAGASVSLGGRPIVRDIDLSVHAGEVVALLGPNGSGKSTLVKAMVGLHPLSAGAVRLFDEPVDQFRQWHRLCRIAQLLPQPAGRPHRHGGCGRRRGHARCAGRLHQRIGPGGPALFVLTGLLGSL